MIEYFPWSKAVHDECIRSYKNGLFSVLDVELGGQCNYQCIYCDSPDHDKRCSVKIEKIESFFNSGAISWVFVCGLGEPTTGENRWLLLKILELCEKYSVKCSMFTNLSHIDDKLLYYVQNGILHFLFKYDSKSSFDCSLIYRNKGASQQLHNIERIKKYVSVSHGHTNIAASIVPTKLNYRFIPDVVQDCLDNGIYPLIAELEHSGEAIDYYDQLALDSTELISLKNKVELITSEAYVLPVCPAVIGGVHVRHDGFVTVDEYTGLSCHWFWLKEPKTAKLGDFNSDDIDTITRNILSYRDSKREILEEFVKQPNTHVFGGCGGDIASLLDAYLKISK